VKSLPWELYVDDWQTVRIVECKCGMELTRNLSIANTSRVSGSDQVLHNYTKSAFERACNR